MENKITKKDNFAEIVNVLEVAGRNDLADVMRHEIELLTAKAEKAKKNAAAKKDTVDALTQAIYTVLGDNYATIGDITASISLDGFDGSTAKVQYRLNQLVKSGSVEKEIQTIGEGTSKRKLMGYRIAPTVEV